SYHSKKPWATTTCDPVETIFTSTVNTMARLNIAWLLRRFPLPQVFKISYASARSCREPDAPDKTLRLCLAREARRDCSTVVTLPVGSKSCVCLLRLRRPDFGPGHPPSFNLRRHSKRFLAHIRSGEQSRSRGLVGCPPKTAT